MRDRWKTKKFAQILALLLVVYLGISMIICRRPSVVYVSDDFDVTDTLTDLINKSDVIVVGKYISNVYDSWNMARSMEDISKEDRYHYSEGHLYKFDVEQVLKGKVEQIITINIPYKRNGYINTSSGNISEQGLTDDKILLKEIHSIDPLYIKPDVEKKYVLFLSYDSFFDYYYGSTEPYRIIIDDDNNLSIESNLLSDSTIGDVIEYDKEKFVIYHNNTRISDFISDVNLNELVNLMGN